MSFKLIPLALLPIFLSACSACSPSGWAAEKLIEKATGVSVNEKDGSVTIKTKDGEMFLGGEGEEAVFALKGKDGAEVRLAGAENKIPKGFPLPVVDGARVTGSMSMGKADEQGFFVTLEIPRNIRDKAADFYEQELRAKGIEVEKSQMEVNGFTTISLSGRGSGGVGSVVSIFDVDDENNTTSNITISWEKKPGGR